MTAPEDNLPPVQPPSAGFLMQLFVVPLVIVMVIVMVCLMFNWLAHMGSQPQDLVRDLSRLNAGSWQKALTIANLLTDRRNDELRQDSQMAKQLADVLGRELEAGDMSAERIKLRVYLCSALGVFEVDDGLPELINAASLQRELAEIEVRKMAVEALASRADQSAARRRNFQQNEPLMLALRQAADQSSDQPDERELDAQLRLRAAFALGVIGGADAQEVLAKMLADPEPTVRYNAATGLARHGDKRSVPRLVEMLQLRKMESSANDATNDIGVTTILQNALRATVQLAEANRDVNLDSVKQAIDQLSSDPQLNDNIRRGILIDVRSAEDQLDQRSARWPSLPAAWSA